MSFKAHDEDIAYINAYLYNETDKPIFCEYSTQFTTPVVNNAGDYYMAISRFSIPNTKEIFEFTPNTSLTLSFGGTDFTTYLVMQSADQNPTTNKIYTYQQFLDMINTAFSTSYQAFITANPGSATTNPPRMVFNPTEDTFSILFDPEYITEGVQLFFNSNLYAFFYNSYNTRNFGRNRSDQKDIEIILQDQGLSRNGQIELHQQIDTLFDWFDFQSILFTNNSLPINQERIASRQSDGRSIDQAIITDFIPELGKDRSNFVYNANPYRLVDMTGQHQIDKLDFRVEYLTKDGTIKPLTLEPGYTMSVKFIFVKKYTVNNF